MLKGLHTTFNQPIGIERMRGIADKGFAMARIDLQGQLNAAIGQECIDEATGAGMVPLVIVRDGHQAMDLPFCSHVELRNEPDIHVGGNLTPAQYAAYVPDFVDACELREHDGYIGVISNLDRDSLEWLRRLWALLPDLPAHIGVAVHLYTNDGTRWDNPHDGFRSLGHQVQALRAIIGQRRLICSEFGYHTAKRKPKEWYRRLFWPRVYDKWTDEQAAANIRNMYAFLEAQGFEIGVLYQCTDGLTEDRLDRYGIHTVNADHSFKAWKPQADAAR
jgi:hypothetical protein